MSSYGMDGTYMGYQYPLNTWQQKNPQHDDYRVHATYSPEEVFHPTQYTQSLVDHRAPTSEKQSKTQVLCRAFGLQLLYSGVKRWRGHRVKETPKPAMLRDRVVALCRSSIHLIPVLAATLMIAINCSKFYLGGELPGWLNQDAQKLAGLQFAAKLHELFMLASITTIVFSYVRRELTNGGGVPFGAIFAGLQVSSISFLWSAEMWGIMMTKWNTRRRKTALITILVFSTLLGVTVGPSTAVLMRPRLEYWPSGGTPYWINGKQEDFWPLSVEDKPSLANCTVDTGDLACPHGHWKSITEQLLSIWPKYRLRVQLPGQINIPGERNGVQFQTTTMGQVRYSNARTMAVGGMFFMADNMAELSAYYVNAAFVIGKLGYSWASNYRYRRANGGELRETYQPAVHVLCNNYYLEAMWFPNMSSYVPPQATIYGTTVDRGNYTNVLYNDDSAKSKFETMFRGQKHDIMWLSDSALQQSTNSSLNALVTVQAPGGTRILGCSIDARYAIGTFTTFPKYTAFTLLRTDWPWGDYGIRNPQWPILKISSDWARYLNPIDPSTNLTIMPSLITSYCPSSRITEFVESMLVMFITNGLSRSAYGRPMLGQPWKIEDGKVSKNSWQWCIMPKSKNCDHPSMFNISDQDQSQATAFQYYAFNEGYSYSSSGATAILAIGVLLCYSVFALLHFVYSFWSGSSSVSWDTPAEITALALQSSTSHALRHTGAGIETTGVFEERVEVKVKDGTLEYVFDDTAWRGDRLRNGEVYS